MHKNLKVVKKPKLKKKICMKSGIEVEKKAKVGISFRFSFEIYCIFLTFLLPHL